MKTLEELKIKFGLTVIPAQYDYPEPTEEVPEPEPVLISEEVDKSDGWNFYGVPKANIEGRFTRYAASQVNSDCMAVIDGDFLYIATKGTSETATQITE